MEERNKQMLFSFLWAFYRKGRFADILSTVPVHVIRNPKAALLGAANYGFAQIQ
jgi:glucokinase